MKPVTQTVLADPTRNDGRDADGVAGNCYQAALASILDLSLDDVPHFATLDGDEWWTESHDWLASRGLMRGMYCDDSETCPPVADCPKPITLDNFVFGDDWPAKPTELVGILGCGPSPRGPFRHVVVLDPDGNCIHDPHPSRAGLELVDELELIFRIERAA